MKYFDLIDQLILHYTGDVYRQEVAAGKKEFFDEAGVIDEENQGFEMRMTQFLEWYIFNRPLDRQQTPAAFALQDPTFKMTSDERPAYENLANTRHGLFEFLKIRGTDIHVRELFLNKKIVIPNSPVNIGFSREEIFDARLIPDGENFQFSRAFCFHPSESSSFILGEVKTARKKESENDNESLMLRLMKMRYKYEQYRHLKLEYVYTNEKKMRF